MVCYGFDNFNTYSDSFDTILDSIRQVWAAKMLTFANTPLHVRVNIPSRIGVEAPFVILPKHLQSFAFLSILC